MSYTVEIIETCCCGASFHVRDESKYGNSVAHRYKDFLEAHKVCRDRTNVNIHLPVDGLDDDGGD